MTFTLGNDCCFRSDFLMQFFPGRRGQDEKRTASAGFGGCHLSVFVTKSLSLGSCSEVSQLARLKLGLELVLHRKTN